MATGQQSEALEDQLRRMIINGGPQPASHDQQQYQGRPIVNLPPNAAHFPQQQHYRQHEAPPHLQQSWRASAPAVGPQSHYPAPHERRMPQQPIQRQQQPVIHANDFSRGPQSQYGRTRRDLYEPSQQQARQFSRQHQAVYLDNVAQHQLKLAHMSEEERAQKHAFRLQLEKVCQEICASHADRLPQVELRCFGSFESGFATANSDMDLVIIVNGTGGDSARFSLSEDDLPRMLEKRLLQLGHGARLLTRTRVPIIKVCELPGPPLLSQLRAERAKWDMKDNDHKYGRGDDDDEAEGPALAAETVADAQAVIADDGKPGAELLEGQHDTTPEASLLESAEAVVPDDTAATTANNAAPEVTLTDEGKPMSKRKPWTRERDAGPLDFPKTGVGIQCDINFFNPLGLHNTQMLRCYSLCDPRVRHIVLFVKAWAKQRMINSSYSGTLSSYGYVLMVLHFLVNVARPPVLPNLQQPWRPVREYAPAGIDRTEVDGWVVDFWCREDEIRHAAANNLLTQNNESVGSLLVGFFQYFAAIGDKPWYHWTQNALSLRTPGGIMSKDEKGWVKARTEEGDGKKVQYRYLFCIEDPFELDHNVARTVTHNGIVAIRDEFRRAARILQSIAYQVIPKEGHLFDEVSEEAQLATETPRPERKPAQQPRPQQKAQPAPQKVDVSSKDAFPDLSAQPIKAKPQRPPKQQPAKPVPADKTIKQSPKPVANGAVPIEATEKPEGKAQKRRRPQRRAVKINEL